MWLLFKSLYLKIHPKHPKIIVIFYQVLSKILELSGTWFVLSKSQAAWAAPSKQLENVTTETQPGQRILSGIRSLCPFS